MDVPQADMSRICRDVSRNGSPRKDHPVSVKRMTAPILLGALALSVLIQLPMSIAAVVMASK